MILDRFIADLYQLLVGKVPKNDNTLIKMHSRSLEQLGDVSFPIQLKSWHSLLEKNFDCSSDHIFGYFLKENDMESGIKKISEKLQNSSVKIKSCKRVKMNTHLYFERPELFYYGINKVLCKTDLYGQSCVFQNSIQIVTNGNGAIEYDNVDLTTLRMLITRDVAINLLKLTNPSANKDNPVIILSIDTKDAPNILCGPVLNQNGVKDSETVANDLFKKRAAEMRMMAQHRCRMQVKKASDWDKYFSTLGVAAVTVELLSNKPLKPIKIALNDLSGANKGPSFIFYNCARLSVLLKEFKRKVDTNVYPALPKLDKINFTLLNQPEEWLLLYVYILQFPNVIRNCIRSIQDGIFNPQNLITFLSNLSSDFSVYYRRVRILTESREHLLETIYSRIYLLMALQYVFHNSLRILNIEPIQEM